MRKQLIGAIGALSLAMSVAVSGSPITYDFTVDATSGLLSGDTASGSFTFDSSTIPSGGGAVGATGLLTALNFTWDGISYNASTANTGVLNFNSAGDLTGFVFGNKCEAHSCVVDGTPGVWFAGFHITGIFAYNTAGVIGEGGLSYSLAKSTPEPGTLGLLGLGLVGVGFSVRNRKN